MLEITAKNCSSTILIDDEDAHLAKSQWRVHGGYARIMPKRKIDGKSRTLYVHMSRVVLGRMMGHDVPAGHVVDHINGNRLDNRRVNLRLATMSGNSQNTSKRPGSSSAYLGVKFRKWKKHSRVPFGGTPPWHANVRCNGKDHHVGYFWSPVAAAVARDKRAIELHGEFARLNFPREELESVA